MAWSSNDQYKIIADKIVSSDPDMVISVAGGLYINDKSEANKVATISDLSAGGEVATIEDIAGSQLLLETGPQTANYTLQLSDLNKVVAMDGTTLTVFVPLDADVAFPIGAVVYAYDLDASTFTVAGVAGVTVRNAGTVTQYSRISIYKRATNEWVMHL
jgi:hypothetical protein